MTVTKRNIQTRRPLTMVILLTVMVVGGLTMNGDIMSKAFAIDTTAPTFFKKSAVASPLDNGDNLTKKIRVGDIDVVYRMFGQGSLVIFVGGEHTTFEQCKPILDVLGKNRFYMGASGMGTTMKLVVNTLLGLGMQALAEAIALGEKAGLEKRLLLEVLYQLRWNP